MRINYERIVHYVYHHHLGIIVFAALMSVGLGYFAAQLRIKADTADLLPDDYVSVRELNRIKERVGGTSPLMIIVTADDLDDAVEAMHALADSIEGSELINAVIRKRNFEFLSRNRLLFMKTEDLQDLHDRVEDHIELEKLKRSPLYFALDDEDEESGLDFDDIEQKYSDYEKSGLERDYFLTDEKNGVILRIYPTGVITDRTFTKALFAFLDSKIAKLSTAPSVEFNKVGSFKNASHQYKVVVDDLKSTALYAFLGVLILISLHFRQLLSPLFVILPLLTWVFCRRDGVARRPILQTVLGPVAAVLTFLVILSVWSFTLLVFPLMVGNLSWISAARITRHPPVASMIRASGRTFVGPT